MDIQPSTTNKKQQQPNNMLSTLDDTPRFPGVSPFEIAYTEKINFVCSETQVKNNQQCESDKNTHVFTFDENTFSGSDPSLSPNYVNQFQLRHDVDRFDFTERVDDDDGPQSTIPIEDVSFDATQEDNNDNDDMDMEYLLYQLSEMKDDLTQLISKIDNSLIINHDNPNSPNPITFESHDHHDPLVTQFKDTLQDLTQLLPSPVSVTPRVKHCEMKAAPVAERLPNLGVILMKWPDSIEQLWDEYVKVPCEWGHDHMVNFLTNLNKMGFTPHSRRLILKRTESISELETRFGSSWRNKDKNFSRQINRRKKIWNSIERGLIDGLTLKECIWVLEKYAKDNNKSLSSYYCGVPFRLHDLKKRFDKETR